MLLDISSLERICSDKRGYAPAHILLAGDMLWQEGIFSWTHPLCRGYAQSRGDMLLEISSLKRICSIKMGYAPWHILFEENMISPDGICSLTYPLWRGYALTRGDMLLNTSSLTMRICSDKRGYAPGHILFQVDMLSQEGICSWTCHLCRGYAQSRGDYSLWHILFAEDMLSLEWIWSCTYPLGRGYAQWIGDMLPHISILQRICSGKRECAPGHILFEEDMHSQEEICAEDMLS
jgi:hypothetical protein